MNEAARTSDSEVVHLLKNHLGIVISYAELLLDATPADNPLHADLIIMRQAAQDALDLTGQLAAK